MSGDPSTSSSEVKGGSAESSQKHAPRKRGGVPSQGSESCRLLDYKGRGLRRN